MRSNLAFAAMQNALDSNQIGTPVSVRAVMHVVEDVSELESVVASTIDHVLAWLGDFAASVSTIGDDSRQTSLLLRTKLGRTALISVGVQTGSSAMAEVIVFGSSGVLFWDDCGKIHIDERPSSNELSGPAREAMKLLNATQQPKSTTIPSSSNEPRRSLLRATLPSPRPQAPPYGLLLVSGDYTHQPGYSEALMADKRCKLIGMTDETNVSDERRQLNRQLADRLGIQVLSDLTEALNREDVDMVSICAEPHRRGRIIVEAARAGKHLYLDKPLAGSVEDAAAIVEAVQENGVVAHMFSQIHWAPARSAQAVLASGELGELIAIHCDACFAKGQAGTADLSRLRIESEVPTRFEVSDSKRELTNIGVYPMAMLFWLLRRDVKGIQCATGNFFFSEHQANDMEDFGQMLMEFEGGITATITAGRAGWRSHPGFGLHRVSLIGTKASVTIDAHRPRVEVWADVEPWTAPPRDPGDPMGMWAAPRDSPYNARPKESWVQPTTSAWVDDAKHFLDCVEQGSQSTVSVDIAAAATEVLMAAYRSAATKKAVRLR